MSAEPRSSFDALPAALEQGQRRTMLVAVPDPASHSGAGEAVARAQSVDGILAAELGRAWMHAAAVRADPDRARAAVQHGVSWLVVASLRGAPSMPDAPAGWRPVRHVLESALLLAGAPCPPQEAAEPQPLVPEPIDAPGVEHVAVAPAWWEQEVAGMHVRVHPQEPGVRWPDAVRDRTRRSVARSFLELERDEGRGVR